MSAPTSSHPAPASSAIPRPDATFGPGFDLALALTSERGWPDEWRPAPHYPGMACAIIDAVMSPHVRSETVAAVVERYRTLHSPLDGPDELAHSFNLHGELWPDLIGTRNRAWRSRRAPLKSDIIASAADLLADARVDSPQVLCERADDIGLRQRWSSLPGQATGATWRHLLLVAGYEHPLVCRLTRKFVRRHHPMLADGARDEDVLEHMTQAARTLGVPVGEVDHQMWRAGARGAPRATISSSTREPLG